MRKALVALAPLALILAACGSPTSAQSEAGAASGSQSETESEHGDHVEGAPGATEQAAAQVRLALTYDGGIYVVNGEDLEVLADIPLEGFSRLNPSGDGRTMMVSTTGGFQVLDMGTWAQAHGDHHHYFTADPVLTDVKYPAQEPGHVVADEGVTTLFDDGSGLVQVVPTQEVAEGEDVTEVQVAPHHGVAVPFQEGLLVTMDNREGVRFRDAAGEWTAEADGCPSIHGEAVVEDKAVFGCADGALVFHDMKGEKITSPDENGRLGTLVASEHSDVVLSNYTPNYDGDAREDQITQVALVDLDDNEIKAVELGTGYSFRSLARGDKGEALVLGADGKLHVIDPESGAEIAAHQVIDPWEVPADWQAPRPAVFVADGSAYVSNPATKELLAVDIETGEIWLKATLPAETNELSGVTGFPKVEPEEAGHDDHDHEGHDHDEAGHDDHDHDEAGHDDHDHDEAGHDDHDHDH